MRPSFGVVLLPLLLFGSATAATDDTGTGPTPGEAAAESRTLEAPATVRGLTCPNDMRNAGTLDYFTQTGGQATPREAAELIGMPDDEIVIETVHGRANAYLLRPDGTAYTSLGIVQLMDETWRVEGIDSCAGELPFGR